ncbi:MAG: hypothetical protein HQK96_13545 [Nitrospirae bacterium]|nr:hypothetical protein [Nitrospirota bacterium]
MEIEAGSEASLSEVVERFKQWRLTGRSTREPIPAELWESSMNLTTRHSICRVLRLLRVLPIPTEAKQEHLK